MSADTTVTMIDLPQDYRNRQAEYDAATRAVAESGRFIFGDQVGELEAQLAADVGVAHCVSCGNGTDAMLLALQALGVGRDDEVITTPFTFYATAEVILALGAVPVFVDIDPETYNLDPEQVAAACTPRTRAILAVSLYGQLPDIAALEAIADAHDIPLIEDAAQSYGATGPSGRSCGVGRVGTTSFFPTKPLGGWGDGGALFTDDAQLAATCRKLRHHGDAGRYQHELVGWNSRLDTLQAAVLQVKLAHFPEDLAARQQAAARYSAALAGVCDIPVVRPGYTSAWAQYTVRLPQRDAVVARLREAGIPVGIHYPMPIYRQPAFVERGYGELSLSEAERAGREVACLPIHPLITPAMQERVVDVLRDAIAAAS